MYSQFKNTTMNELVQSFKTHYKDCDLFMSGSLQHDSARRRDKAKNMAAGFEPAS